MDTTPTVPEQPVKSVPAPAAIPRRKFPLWGAAVIALLVGGGVLMTWRSYQQYNASPPVPTPTPTAIPTPTPIRTLSRLASQSAFLSLEANVATLSSQLRNFVTEDPSLNPPVLDLPLGF